MKLLFRKITLFIYVLALFFPSYSFANEDLSITLTPKNPNPYTEVTLNLVSYSFNVNTALITWLRDGKTILSGVGEKRLVIKTGATGEPLPISVRATTGDGTVVEAGITIIPKSVHLFYETPESYVPPFYEGKALPGEGALVRFVAIPSISENNITLSPSSLSYSWYVNGNLISNSSGIGKQVAMIPLDYLSSHTNVKVVVRSQKGEVAEKSIDVYPHAVMPLIYEYDSLFGVNLTTLVSRRFEATKDFTIAFEPFFLSVSQTTSPSYTWFLGGLPSTPEGGRLLSFHPKENDYGTKILNIKVNNRDKINQEAETTVELIFDTRQ